MQPNLSSLKDKLHVRFITYIGHLGLFAYRNLFGVLLQKSGLGYLVERAGSCQTVQEVFLQEVVMLPIGNRASEEGKRREKRRRKKN